MTSVMQQVITCVKVAGNQTREWLVEGPLFNHCGMSCLGATAINIYCYLNTDVATLIGLNCFDT